MNNINVDWRHLFGLRGFALRTVNLWTAMDALIHTFYRDRIDRHIFESLCV